MESLEKEVEINQSILRANKVCYSTSIVGMVGKGSSMIPPPPPPPFFRHCWIKLAIEN